MSKQSKEANKHHIFFKRREYDKGQAKMLRYHPYCIVLIPIWQHDKIHASIEMVPIPNSFNSKCAITQLNGLLDFGAITLEDPIDKRLRVLISLFECVEQPTADALKDQLEVVHKYYRPPR